MTKQFMVFFILMVILSACAAYNKQKIFETDVMNTSEAPDKISFVDLSVFDKKLSMAMKVEHMEIGVDMIQESTINNIPNRMDRWLYMIDEYGGTVETRSITRGFTSIAIDLVVGVYKAIRKKHMYTPAKNYNATIYYHPESGMIKNIIFTHKVESYEMGSGEMESYEMESDEMESHEMESYDMETYEMDSNEMGSNEMESDKME